MSAVPWRRAERREGVERAQAARGHGGGAGRGACPRTVETPMVPASAASEAITKGATRQSRFSRFRRMGRSPLGSGRGVLGIIPGGFQLLGRETLGIGHRCSILTPFRNKDLRG